jgi:hypothetical protein
MGGNLASGWVYLNRISLALAGLKLGVALANHEHLAATTHNFAVGVTALRAAEGTEDLHGSCLSFLKLVASSVV